MPHDKNGTELKVGDKVIIRGTVTNVSPQVGYCNITVVSEEGRKPDDAKETYCTNAAVLERVEEAKS